MPKDYIRYSVITKPDLSQTMEITNQAGKTTATIDTANINEINYMDFHTSVSATEKYVIQADSVLTITFSAEIYEIVIQNTGSTKLYIEFNGTTTPSADSLELGVGETISVNLKKTANSSIKVLSVGGQGTLKLIKLGH